MFGPQGQQVSDDRVTTEVEPGVEVFDTLLEPGVQIDDGRPVEDRVPVRTFVDELGKLIGVNKDGIEFPLPNAFENDTVIDVDDGRQSPTEDFTGPLQGLLGAGSSPVAGAVGGLLGAAAGGAFSGGGSRDDSPRRTPLAPLPPRTEQAPPEQRQDFGPVDLGRNLDPVQGGGIIDPSIIAALNSGQLSQEEFRRMFPNQGSLIPAQERGLI